MSLLTVKSSTMYLLKLHNEPNWELDRKKTCSGKETQYIWYQFRCRSCRKSVSLTTDPPAGLHPGFLFRGWLPQPSLSSRWPQGSSTIWPIAGGLFMSTRAYSTHRWACIFSGIRPLSPCSSAWGRKVPSFHTEALHRACHRRGFVLAERDLRTRLSFSHYC